MRATRLCGTFTRRPARRHARSLAVTGTALAALLTLAGAADVDGDASITAGALTVARFDQDAYLQPAPHLPITVLRALQRGRKHFDKTWASVSSLQFEWGLGPTFNAKSCAECHVRGGRGRVPESATEQLHSVVVRVSVPGTSPDGGPVPDPAYGAQLQNDALRGPFPDFAYHTAPVPPEAALYVDWDTHVVTLPDGTAVELRRPRLRVEHLAFGPLAPGTMTSLRIAQPLHGTGLLEAVPESTLVELAARQRRLGFGGHPNRVHDDVNGGMTLGRFGWKAGQPGIRQQIALASFEDMGLTSRTYRQQNCPPVQKICAMQTPGNDPELVVTDWDELELWTRALAVPARRNASDPDVIRGESLFTDAGCAICHAPVLHTAERFPALPQLAAQTIHPYTDLLLHDMGDGLADGRPEFAAGPRDWRTPALWGLGLSGTVNGSRAMLHDGRARTVGEAILWHGGEAARSRDAFARMPAADRDALVRFVESL
ncbi:MAG: thiol oxidoreductase [Betaproteobacteria bacterium]|nr:thiol oxidoreductase [Betaproteobacteria bacterium]